MSADHTTQRQESQHTTEVHSYHSNDPHTAIPDWLPFAAGIGPEARNLIMASLVLEKRGAPPTRRQLAQALQVDERSIYRWLREIAAAGALSVRREKRRRINVFHRPKPDRLITDRLIADPTISDQAIRMAQNDSLAHVSQQSHESRIPDQAISDPDLNGWLGATNSLDSKKQPTKPPRRKLVTPLAKWLRHKDMVGAHLFDNPALDEALYCADFLEKRHNGMPIGRIVEVWLAAPLEAPQPSDPLASDWYDPEQLADDQSMLPQIPTAAEHKAMVEAQWKRGVAK